MAGWTYVIIVGMFSLSVGEGALVEQRVERYEDRERLERDVERLSDEGWVLERISQLSGDVVEAAFLRRPSAVSDGSLEEPQATT